MLEHGLWPAQGGLLDQDHLLVKAIETIKSFKKKQLQLASKRTNLAS
ncbi:MAG TPA: hypothetical protein PKV16_04730 [Caldisericia bacterium]|nr:hypothetical protein [Caldisericia bacterium]HPF48616.1 hypothetical protein [Caldisericia bacterium]HPI83724.1 hypothetical protein [Caldisericia bacterium]HPQ93071.1 hypothetical protein [Caldisericia bacterium]HRV75096.1 hypothetical protein [Caldisericia bacterium]